MGRTVIIVPHLDDAVLSCWWLIEQSNVLVITIYAGIPTRERPSLWDRLCGFKNAKQAMQDRRQEHKAALRSTSAVIGNLEYPDHSYQTEPPAMDAIADEVERLAGPGAAFVVAAGVGTRLRRHSDHIATRQIGQLLQRRGRQVVFYADLPYMLPLFRLANWPAKLRKGKIERALGAHIKTVVHKLTPEQQLRKCQAVQAYRSQVRAVNAFIAFGALRREAAYRREAIFQIGKPNSTVKKADYFTDSPPASRLRLLP